MKITYSDDVAYPLVTAAISLETVRVKRSHPISVQHQRILDKFWQLG